jgi:hypothetical protein
MEDIKTSTEQKKELWKTYEMMEGVFSVTGLSRSNIVKVYDNELISDHMDQWITFIIKTHELHKMNFQNCNLKTTSFKYGLDLILDQVSYSCKTGL